MRSTATIILGIILVGMIAVTAFASAGYIRATTDSSSGTPSSGTRNGMMGGGMMGGYGYADCPYDQEYQQRYCLNNTYSETNGSVCPHMDSGDIGLNNTAHPCMR